MRIKRYKNRKDLVFTFLRIGFAVSLICLCINFFYSRLRPMIIIAIQNQAKNIVTIAIDKVITEELTKNSISHSDIVTISHDSDGRLTSIETNTVIANFFKAKIISAVITEFRKIELQNLSIPIGTLSDSPFLYGKGPRIDLKISTSGVADAKFESEFFSAGINQTCHRIKLVVDAEIYVLVPGFSTSTKLITDYYIAETIIVGATPDFFADIS